MLRSLAVLGAGALTLQVAGPAGAVDTEAWRYQCLGDEVVGSRICTTELAVLVEGEEFIVYFVHTKKGVPPLVVAGESDATAAVAIAVDKKDPVTAESCEAGACFFTTEDSRRLMVQFRKGFRAKVTILDMAQRVLFDRVLSLRGFTAALTPPPPEPD